MMSLQMHNLETCFESATNMGAKYMGIALELPNTKGKEVIINGAENFQAKAEFYAANYNEFLEHNHVQGLKIVGFSFGDTFKDIERDLVGTGEGE